MEASRIGRVAKCIRVTPDSNRYCMKRLVLFLLLGLVAWQGYSRYQHNRAVQAANSAAEAEAVLPFVPILAPSAKAQAAPDVSFKCDGRTRCSQMSSCAEATYFLRNCPGVKMDGNNDGVPCEQQWCTR